MLDVVKLILIPVFMCMVCYMFGTLLSVKIKNGIGERISLGFLGVIALFQIVALPFMYFESSVTWLYRICIGFVVLLMIGYVGYILKTNAWKNRQYQKFFLKKRTRKEVIFWGIVLGLIVFQVFYVFYFQYSNYDDSYYIAQINTIVETNYLMNVEPTTGIGAFNQNVTYKLIGHEVLLSMIVKMFNVNAAFLSHMIMPLFMIPLHYIVVYQLAKEIKYEYRNIFFLFSTIINMFSGFSGSAAPAWLLLRIWQGKAVLVSILLPMLLLEFVKIYRERKVSVRSLIAMTSMLWAGFFASTVGLYLVPVAYFAYTVTFFFTYKDWKNSLKLCIPVFFSLPYVFAKMLLFLSQSYFEGISDVEVTHTYRDIFFSKYLSNHGYGGKGNYVLAAFLLFAIIYIWKKGTKVEKMISVYVPIVLFLTFLNPLLKPILSSFLEEELYYRFFWLFNFRYIVVIAMILYVAEEINRKFISVLVMILLITGTGEYLLQAPSFVERKNRYKLSNRVIWISDEIIAENDSENNYLLMPDKYSWEVREYTGKIRMVWARYTQSFYKEKEFKKLENLYNELYIDKKWDSDKLEDKLNDFHVNYLYLDDEAIKENGVPSEWEIILKREGFTVYKI